MSKYQISKVNKALTLTELLVIIGLIGTLALIGFPAFRAYKPSLELSGAVRELVADLRYAEQLAVAEQINHGIRFFSSTDQYQIIKYGGTEEILEEKLFPPEVSFQEITGFTNDEVVFNPYGAAEEAGTVTLINTKNSTTVLDIRPSGFIRVID